MAQKKDYTELAQQILDNVGGKENITSVAHCITRLRLKLKDWDKPDTEAIEKLPGVIKVMVANGQYQVVVGNKIEDVYNDFLEVSSLGGGGEVAAANDAAPAEDEKKSVASVLIDLISGIFQPTLATMCAAGVVKGLLALLVFVFPNFANDGAYKVLYTVADGFFYFMPVILGYTAAEKFKLNKFVGMCLGISLVYPTMVALTSGDVLGSMSLGFFGAFSWYSTFFGLPIIMPASGYTSSVIPIILMAWFGSKVEHWVKSWCPQSLKMFLVPMLTMIITVVAGYLVIGPVATLITNMLQSIFELILNIPVIGTPILSTVVGAFWMVLVVFGFHWAVIPMAIVNIGSLGYDYLMPGMLWHGFALGAVLFAMYLKNRDENFREVCLPAMISAFFFGVTEPAIYGVALPDKRAFVNACIGSGVCGLFMGIFNVKMFIMGGLGMFRWLSYIDTANVAGAGISYMVLAIIGSLIAAVIGFAIEFMTYKPEAEQA